MIHIYIPYLILPLYAVLESIEPTILEAAWDLGSGRVRTFLSFILPLSLPGVTTGCLFVFIPSMGAFITPELLGGTQSIMIGSIIAQQFGVAYDYPFGSALALVLMGLILGASRAHVAGRPTPGRRQMTRRDPVKIVLGIWTAVVLCVPVRPSVRGGAVLVQ